METCGFWWSRPVGGDHHEIHVAICAVPAAGYRTIDEGCPDSVGEWHQRIAQRPRQTYRLADKRDQLEVCTLEAPLGSAVSLQNHRIGLSRAAPPPFSAGALVFGAAKEGDSWCV